MLLSKLSISKLLIMKLPNICSECKRKPWAVWQILMYWEEFLLFKIVNSAISLHSYVVEDLLKVKSKAMDLWDKLNL